MDSEAGLERNWKIQADDSRSFHLGNREKPMWPEGSELIWQPAESRGGAWEREGTLTQVSL